MTLEHFEFLPRGDGGWACGPFSFGRNTTLLLGPNGAGKTPIMKAIAYCLGHPVELPPLIQEKCRAARLTIAASDGLHTIERQLVSGLHVTVESESGTATLFTDERNFSEWMLPKLGVSLRSLLSRRNEASPPYMSVVGPMFLVDQDTGWVTLYVPFESHHFVKDQRLEVARWILDVPPKNRPVDKGDYEAAKVTQGALQEQIAFKRKALEALQREIGEDAAPGAAPVLEERKLALDVELVRAYAVLETSSQPESPLELRLKEAIDRRDEIAFKLLNAKRRKAQLAEVQAEVGAELGALEQSEVAAAAFRNLCGSDACQFFRKPEESYGRQVLYLKDQLKDFQFSTGATESELTLLQQQLTATEAAVQEAADFKRSATQNTNSGTAVAAIQMMSRELTDIGVRLDRLKRIARERAQLDVLIDRELRAADDVSELRPSGGGRRDSTRLLDARHKLAASFREWLVALRTPNVPGDVSFDDDLRLTVSGEVFSATSSHSGSTRTRLVLALHAAFLETSLAMGGSHPRLLLLDAPRQHELSAPDLRSFVKRFYEMSSKATVPVQLILSATKAEVAPKGMIDRTWEPSFMSDRKRRFLGRIPSTSGQ